MVIESGDHKRWVLLGLILFCLGISHAQPPEAARATLDRNSIAKGESVLLSIEIPADGSADSPDIGKLKRDFTIVDTTRSSQLTIINGKPSGVTQWMYELEPNQTGTLLIPAMAIGPRYRTPELRLQVSAAASDASLAEALFLETEADPLDGYVQGQIRYTERLFYDLALREGSINRNDWPENLVRRQIGDDNHYIDQRNGRNYRVLERRYALFPQHSGALQIPPIEFSGRVSEQGRRRGRKVQVRSGTLALTIRPRPGSFVDAQWLPSNAISVTESWSVEPLQLRVGEPVTRTLTLSANGLGQDQLPEFELADITNATLYPDQASRHERSDTSSGWLQSTLQQRVAIIPTQAGQLHIPALQIHWWDTKNDRAAVAMLAARTLNVLQAEGAPTQQLPTQPIVSADEKAPAQSRPGGVDAPPTEIVPQEPKSAASANGIGDRLAATRWREPGWHWATIGFLLLWLATIAGWLADRRRNGSPQSQPATEPGVTLRQARQQIRIACAADDAAAAEHAILIWAGVRWPEDPPQNLGSCANRLENLPELGKLQQQLYGAAELHTATWDGKTFWRALVPKLDAASVRATRHTPPALLPPLYPQHSSR